MPQSTSKPSAPRAQRRSRQWWFEQVCSWQSSGLSAAQFCAANGLKPAALYRWSSRLRQQTDQPVDTSASTTSRSSFVAAHIVPEAAVAVASALTVEGVTVRFDTGLAPAALAEWVRALRALPC